jgi:hypothetical protein
MNRVFLAAVVWIALPFSVYAEDKVVRLKVQPMPAPIPALRYLLLPEVRELNPGNPAQWYMRCFAEQRNFFFNKESVAQRERYLAMSLDELRAEKIGQYGRGPLTQADWAARLDALDWQVLERVQTDGLDLRQPELGPLRILATALKVRFRIEAAGRRFDDAVVTAKTMFALARHLGENPTHSANELGLFVARLAVDVLEEMVQQPGCPNLYWALTDLPMPLVDLHKGFQGERKLLETELQSLRADAAMTTPEEVDKVVSRLSGVMGYARMKAGQPPYPLQAELKARAKDADKVRAIRDRLREEKRTALAKRAPGQQDTVRDFFGRLLEMNSALERIEKLPPLRLILLEEKQQLAIRSDERMKLLALAPWQIDKLSGEELEKSVNCLLAEFLPPVVKSIRERGRLEQRIALLRYVEAMRLYAAGHDGKLPERLADIAEPLPNDPFTGKPFVYRAKGATARLRVNSPRGEEKNVASNVVYEVTIQK